jgi:putative oxidoreductase
MRVVKILGMVLLWTLQLLAAAAFVAIGVAKFAAPEWARNFARWGYPDGFYMVVGAVELTAGVLLLVPKLTSYAATLLGAIMIGAAATHLLHNETARVAAPLIWLGMMALLGLARRRRAWRPAPRPLPLAADQV